ncbi:MAG: hypothetical protein QXG12_05130 [Thermoproteota archaeon]
MSTAFSSDPLTMVEPLDCLNFLQLIRVGVRHTHGLEQHSEGSIH